MQFETANFTPSTASWHAQPKTSSDVRLVLLHNGHMSCLWFWPINSTKLKHDVIHKTGSTQHIALLSEEEQVMVTSGIYWKLCELWSCGFWDMQADRQTNRQANKSRHRQTHWLQYFAPLLGVT